MDVMLLRIWARISRKANWQTSAAGIESMYAPPKTLKATREAIRDLAVNVNQAVEPREDHSK
jgi:hypothetical protein